MRACMQVTYYEFQKEEVDAALEGHRRGQRSLSHVPSRVENKEAFNILMVRSCLKLSHEITHTFRVMVACPPGHRGTASWAF